MDPSDREVRTESDRKGDEAEKWQARSKQGDQRPLKMEGGGSLLQDFEKKREKKKTARGVKVRLLTSLATGPGQLPKDRSAHSKNQSTTLVFVWVVKTLKQVHTSEQEHMFSHSYTE